MRFSKRLRDVFTALGAIFFHNPVERCAAIVTAVTAATADEIVEGQGAVPGQGTAPDVAGTPPAAAAAAAAASTGGPPECRGCKGSAPRAWLTAGKATFGRSVCPL